MAKVNINPHERVDDLHRNGYLLIQDPSKFCFGIDAVLLASFAVAKQGERVMDMCTGTGVVPILMEAKTEGKSFTGIEIQPESVEMAQRSVLLNDLQDKITICQGDIKELDRHFGLGSFDVVTCNPPYMQSGGGMVNEYTAKAVARHEILCTLEDVVTSADKMLRVGGRLYMVHRPTRLPEIFSSAVNHHLEPKRMRLVHTYINKEPTLALIEFIKGGRPMLKVEPPIIIYNADGEYTSEIKDIYYN